MHTAIKQSALLRSARHPRVWSVSFEEGSQTGTREDLASGLVAEVGREGGSARNDFDRIPIFSRPIFNATWDRNARRWTRLVRMGKSGFTWTPTSDRYCEVVYRCMPFWYKLEMSSDHTPLRVSVSDQPLAGFRLAPMFKNGHTPVYRPCFEMGIGRDGYPHSRADLEPLRGDALTLMQKAREYDGLARTESIKDWFSDALLQLVEFATWDFHGIMPGNVGEGAMATGTALRQLMASSGHGLSGDPCVWRGKENPWKNVNSLLCDVLLQRAEGTSTPYLEMYYLPQMRDYDGTLNNKYRKLGRYLPYRNGAQIIGGFTLAEDVGGFFFPSHTGGNDISQKGFAYTYVDPALTLPVALGVGGGSTGELLPANAASSPMNWECADTSTARGACFGARLVLDEA